jgi:hypothetical protein
MVSALINHGALEKWLESHPPQSFLSYVDRLLIATVGNLPERKSLISKSQEAQLHVVELAKNDLLLQQITNVLILLTLFQEEGIASDECKEVVKQILPVASQTACAWFEPFKSTYFYWLGRSGMGQSFPVGPDPGHHLLRLYHATHRVLFAGDYGLKAVPRESYGNSLRECESVLSQHSSNADAVAEVLLAEAMLIPRDEERCNSLRFRLAALQLEDGSFSMPGGASPDAIHHACCVALLAERLIQSPPPLARIADSNNFK